MDVRGLRKVYGGTAVVDDVSFSVAPGEIVGILGPNGSGKTTTVECLEGLRRPDGGEIRVLGLDPRTQVTALRRRIGCQLQDAALPERLRVGEAIRLFAAVGGHRVDIDGLLDEWGLGEKRAAPFSSLSGGQRQRLFVALALVNDPELVFLDEMTTGLDPVARRDAWRQIERVRALGAAIVLVTHFMDEAERLCDRLVVLRDGVVVATGTPAELVRRHGGGVTASFTSDLPPRHVRGAARRPIGAAARSHRGGHRRAHVAPAARPAARVRRPDTGRPDRPAGHARGRLHRPGHAGGGRPVNGRVMTETSRVELLLLLREPVTLVFALALPVVNVVVLGGVFGISPTRPVRSSAESAGPRTTRRPTSRSCRSVGLISFPPSWPVTASAVCSAASARSGLPVSAVVTAQLGVGLGLAGVGAVVVTAVSFLTNEPEPPDDLLGVVVAFAIGAAALILLGVLLGALLPTARAAQGAGVLIWFVLLILGGAGPPPEVLPAAMGTVGAVTPLRPLVLALQDPWFGGSSNVAMLAVLVAIGGASWIVAACGCDGTDRRR